MPRVFDLIRPLDNRDTYAITDVIFQKGGLREVENIVARNAISMERRTSGMIAFTVDTGEFYSLTGGDLTNNSWEKIDFAPNILGKVKAKEFVVDSTENSVSNEIGVDLSIDVLKTSILKVREGSSIASLIDVEAQDGKILFLQNVTNNELIIRDNYFNTLNDFTVLQTGLSQLREISTSGTTSVIVSDNGELLISTDMETWSPVPDIETNSWQSVVYSNNLFVAISSDGDNRVIFSDDDGLTWASVAVQAYEWTNIIYENDLFVAVSNGKAMYSTDAVEWTYVTLPTMDWKSIAFGNNLFVIVASSMDGEDDIIYSQDDGITWQNANKPNNDILKKIRFADGAFYVIGETSVMSSVDGNSWLLLDLPFGAEEIQEIIFHRDYHLFFKKNTVYYTNNFDLWKEYQFLNSDAINDLIVEDEEYYFLTDTKINKITLDLVMDNNYPIFTGSNRDLTLLENSSIILQFSSLESAWRIIGGIASNPTFLGLLDSPDVYPVVPENNNIFVTVNPSLVGTDRVIFNNPFPVIENEDENLVIDTINNLRIRRFDSETGEIVFAKFTPTISANVPSQINYDAFITSINDISVTNDTFIPAIKVNTIEDISYYKNDDEINTVTIVTSPSLPYINNNFSWSEDFVFDIITDVNSNFGVEPTSFNFKILLRDTSDVLHQLNKTITYRTPDFNFVIGAAVQDFRDTINTCTLVITYENVSFPALNVPMQSISANTPGNPSFSGFATGMPTYIATNLNITISDLVKTNTLLDTKDYTFTAICRFNRPFLLDSDLNYFEVEKQQTFSVNFTYPIFVGTTSITITELTEADVLNLANVGSAPFPRTFSGNSPTNVHLWFAVRKRYINGRTPVVTLASNSLLMETVIIYENDVEITTVDSIETYTCYCILLQANNTYSINISV